jgi:formate hydrogenlyase subunit 4
MELLNFIPLLLALVFAPLLEGLIRKTKAIFAGRKGFPLLQAYRDLFKLLKKGAVYSDTVTAVFKLAPAVQLSVMILAAAFLPFGGLPGVFSFGGDFIVIIFLMGLSRFFLVLGAMDTGSSFEGMGANREAFFSILIEPALLLGFAVLTGFSTEASLNSVIRNAFQSLSFENITLLLLVCASFLILALAENSRVPFDDPTTHLELTMIHEVMILDNSGPDLAMIEYGASLKLWFFFTLIADIFPALHYFTQPFRAALTFVVILLLSVLAGVVESVMARLRLTRIPQLLSTALAFSLVAILLKSIL